MRSIFKDFIGFDVFDSFFNGFMQADLKETIKPLTYETSSFKSTDDNTYLAELTYPSFVTADMIEGLEAEELGQIVADKAVEIYEAKCKALAEIKLDPQRIEREILLRVVDSLWRDHIDFMEILRGEIGLRAYGNHDPILAFKKESSEA